MRKLIALTAASLVLASLVGGSAGAAKKKVTLQHVEASILIPQGGNAAATCVYRAQRMFMLNGADQANGLVGYTFMVDPGTVGKKFTLEAGDGIGMDISFYMDLGDADPTVAPANIAFENTGVGGESGTVPDGYPYAMVCMTDGTNGSFVYKAGKGVK